MKQRVKWDVLAFVFGLCILVFSFGYGARARGWFPDEVIRSAIDTVTSDRVDNIEALTPPTAAPVVTTVETKDMQPGLSLVVGQGPNGQFFTDDGRIRVVDKDSNLVFEWQTSQKKIWPTQDHIVKLENHFIEWPDPNKWPGNITEALLLDDGSVVFNFMHAGLQRVDACGNVVWKLPILAHHTIAVGPDGNLWVNSQKNHKERMKRFPDFAPPFIEPIVAVVSMDGKLLREISLLDVLHRGGYEGLLYSGNFSGGTHDPFHVNDLEFFPSDKEPGIFAPGDVILSIRIKNAFVVLDEKMEEVKYVYSAAEPYNQHDPDFLNGNEISFFDNGSRKRKNSLIRILDARDGSISTHPGTKGAHFFSLFLGKHHWLKNGNLLVVSGLEGRAFEFNTKGDVVWKYEHQFGKRKLIVDVQRLDEKFDAAFFSSLKTQCSR